MAPDTTSTTSPTPLSHEVKWRTSWSTIRGAFVAGVQGVLVISATETPRLMRSYIEVPRSVNLNFVDRLIIRQDFSEQAPGQWYKEREVMDVAFRIYWKLLSLSTHKSGSTTSTNSQSHLPLFSLPPTRCSTSKRHRVGKVLYRRTFW